MAAIDRRSSEIVGGSLQEFHFFQRPAVRLSKIVKVGCRYINVNCLQVSQLIKKLLPKKNIWVLRRPASIVVSSKTIA